MNKEEAYHIIGKHIYAARLKYEEEKVVIILADTMAEATEKACMFFGLSCVSVEKVQKTNDPQIYEV